MKFEKKYNEISLFFQLFDGIGEKKSKTLTLQLLNLDKNKISFLIELLKEVKENIKRCSLCNAFSYKEDICDICSDSHRNNEILVVEDYEDLISIERTKVYNGYYFVINNLISPIRGITPDDIYVEKLINFIKIKNIQKIIFGLPKSTEGNITTNFLKIYLQKSLNEKNLSFFDLAEGLSGGYKISEFSEETLKHSIKYMKSI